ncbi:hypothetical protein CEXT_695731 [Caerostris extrusa]|uniref:Uncharacterized protein n=1 Tax=Caerostris extrusa TaxID=172846 RepID=A0AAV4Q1J1_CAEEX|nr:hypothetical protein CEXT_695731 [Caerostris extrusa]
MVKRKHQKQNLEQIIASAESAVFLISLCNNASQIEQMETKLIMRNSQKTPTPLYSCSFFLTRKEKIKKERNLQDTPTKELTKIHIRKKLVTDYFSPLDGETKTPKTKLADNCISRICRLLN